MSGKDLEGKNTTCLSHRFNDEDTGHYGLPRKMPRKKWLIKGNIFNANDTLCRFNFQHTSTSKKGYVCGISVMISFISIIISLREVFFPCFSS